MIKSGMVVGIAYVVKNANGDEVDSATSDAPFHYLQGGQEMIPGLEEALEGLKVGAHKEVVVPPEKAYGKLNPKLLRKVPRNVFPKDFPVEPGIQFEADLGDNDNVVYTIREVGETVTVDGNHPLAGETLHFTVDIVSVRPATPEELEHGHSHDPDEDPH